VQDKHIRNSPRFQVLWTTQPERTDFMLRELYYGKVIPWERKSRICEAQSKMLKKIEEEENYFLSKLSPEDGERFKAFQKLNADFTSFEDGETFSYGLTMGVLLMIDIFDEAKFMQI